MIFLTGSTGFVGTSVLKYFGAENFHPYKSSNDVRIQSESVVMHFAGHAHDLKNVSSPSKYYEVNTELTKKVFDAFLASNAQVFITLSSVKAAADVVEGALFEETTPNPITHYGKSKLLAEQYILSQSIPEGKRVYIIRPCMIHGPGNKGNLNLLYKVVRKGFPWPLGAFENKRSFCSIDNLCFVLKELIENDQIPSGIYNIADDDSFSTNDLIQLMAESQRKKYFIWKFPKSLIYILAKIGDVLRLPINTERLQKLTETYIVSNRKIKIAIQKQLPLTAREGLMKTFNALQHNA